jgi:hypothetical protein
MNSKFVFYSIVVLLAAILAFFKLPSPQMANNLLYAAIFFNVCDVAFAIYQDSRKVLEVRSRSLENPVTLVEKILSFILSPKIFAFIAPVILGFVGLNTSENVDALTGGVSSAVSGDIGSALTVLISLLGVFVTNYFKDKKPEIPYI